MYRSGIAAVGGTAKVALALRIDVAGLDECKLLY